MSGTSTQPVNLTKVDVVGTEHGQLTNEFLEKLLTPILGTSDKTIGQLITEANKTVENLQYTGLFKSINVKINEANGLPRKDILGEDVLNVDAELDLQLTKLSNYSVSSVHNNYGNAIGLGYNNKNFLENGETFKALTILNRVEELKSSLIDVQFKSPMLDPSLNFVFNGLYHDNQFKIFDSKQQTLGFQLGFEKQKICKCSSMSNTFTGGLAYFKRAVTDIKDNASDEIKAYAGDDIKQSFFLNGIMTNMEYVPQSSELALNGLSLKFQNELAGVLASEDEDKFYKFELDLQLAKSTPDKWFTLTSGIQLGNIAKLQDSNGTIHFQDKFYPQIPGGSTPLQQKSSAGALSYFSYNIGFLSKLGFKSTGLPLRAYGGLRGTVLNPSGFSKSTESFNHGADIGLIYQTETASARVFCKNKLDASATPLFGFEVSINGDW